IKGGGAALTREKVVAYNAEQFIVIADESKLQKSPIVNIPIECIKFSAPLVLKTLEGLGYDAKLRFGTGKVGPIISDNNNFIIDAKIEVKNASTLESMLNSIPGVLENGIFTRFEKILIGTEKDAYELK
ncbi:ribose-5-phosphate isomerase A, partial [Candidatus Micrarchaeota archaeon]|nr:ribose-5-phosphate isomerase A [Candidatus Micrarchaeota archaeon]